MKLLLFVAMMLSTGSTMVLARKTLQQYTDQDVDVAAVQATVTPVTGMYACQIVE
jgi:hypoxanthine phosphoribosyltransferase